jgi:hypothetical protein
MLILIPVSSWQDGLSAAVVCPSAQSIPQTTPPQPALGQKCATSLPDPGSLEPKLGVGGAPSNELAFILPRPF